MFWQLFLQCPQCQRTHTSLEVAFTPNGVCKLFVKCCGKTIAHDSDWEEIIAGATEREEAFLSKTKEGKKKLEDNWSKEN